MSTSPLTNFTSPTTVDSQASPLEPAEVARDWAKEIADRAELVRLKRGFTYRELAERAHLHFVHVHRLCKGKSDTPTIPSVYWLAKGLGVRVCWLAFGDGPMEEEP